MFVLNRSRGATVILNVFIHFQGRSVIYTTAVITYISSLYWYLYNVVQIDSRRAEILGSTASSINTIMVTMPFFEIVSIVII